MNAKLLSRGLAVALAASLVALVLVRREQQAGRETQSIATSENRALRDQLAAAEKRLARLSAELRAKEESPPPGPPPREGFVVGVEPVREVFLGAPPPELQRLHALHERAALDARYGALFKALKLAPEKLEKLKALLVEREVVFADVLAAAAERGIDLHGDPAALRRAVAAAQGEVDRSIRDTLGETAYNDYEQYRQTLAQRAVVNQLEQKLSYSAEPLTAAQSAQLLQTLAAHPAAPAAPLAVAGDAVFVAGSSAGAGPAPMMGGPPIADAAVAQAQGFLSPAQLRALQELQAQQRAQQELLQNMAPPFGGPGGGSISIRSDAPPPRR